MEDINAKVKKRAAEIEAVIDKYLPAQEGMCETVIDAMNYSVHVGGKRLRPMLMQEVYRMFGKDDEAIEPFMAAIEMIHTYSLVHDDLPAMDNDEYRRGKKSTHAQYGEAMGILAGDGLLNYAFETALKAADKAPAELVIKAMKVLADKAGINGMIGGQVVDIESENKAVSMDVIKYIHENKTAAMIESSVMIGAIMAGASDEEVKILEKVGSDVGLAFQIQDDILDVISTTEVLGKPVGSDEKNGKTTYVTLVGLQQAKADVKQISERAIDNLKLLSVRNTFFEQIIDMLIDRQY